MSLLSAEELLELREEFESPPPQEERRWEYVKTGPDRCAILPSAFPKVLFRGQGRRYSPSYTALARGLNSPPVRRILELSLSGQAKLVVRIVQGNWLSIELEKHPASAWLREQKVERFDRALAQHYGVPTGYMDLSESFDVSCFFATCAPDESGEWQPRAKGVGVMYMLPVHPSFVRPDRLQAIGLQVLPRPREQYGWLAVCGIGDNFEDIPGMRMVEFEHDPEVGKYFLEKFSGGRDLFPPDAIASVADRILRSKHIPLRYVEAVVQSLKLNGDLTESQDKICRTISEELNFELSGAISVLDKELIEQAQSEWNSRRPQFLKGVGFGLVRRTP